MSAYVALFKARLQMGLQYRAAALAGLGTQLFWGIIRLMIFEAFFRSSAAPQPITYQQTVDYLWLTQALLLILPMRLEGEIQQMIRTGAVAYELARPTDLYWFWFFRSGAGRTAALALRAAPLYLLAWLFLGLKAPPSWASAGAFLLSLACASALGCALATLMTISLLWTVSGEGISRLLNLLAYVFSGSVVPLPFYPAWAQRALAFLPFGGLMDTPFRIYSGHIPPEEALGAIGHQIVWTVALILLGRWILGRGLRRLTVQGG